MAFGAVVIQGHGQFGVHHCESPNMIRFGNETYDEFFVSESTAKEGFTIQNNSKTEPLVILKHFGPNHKDMP